MIIDFYTKLLLKNKVIRLVMVLLLIIDREIFTNIIKILNLSSLG